VTVSQEMRAREYTMSAHEINALLYTCQAAGRWSLHMPLSLFKLSGDLSWCSADFHMCEEVSLVLISFLWGGRDG
jgi:hypothetical protein